MEPKGTPKRNFGQTRDEKANDKSYFFFSQVKSLPLY